jgi:GNAT superfamily N-acetyltransferase
MKWKKDGFIITTHKHKMDIPYIHDYICNKSYWAEGIPLAIVKQSIKGSLCFGVFHAAKQIGFARLITDRATFGYLADVFIDENYRGKGLGKWLMEIIISHPELQGLRNWMLATLDAHGLYEKVGFKPLENPERIMRKNNPDLYKKKIS